jgi:hypothetical protein
VAYALIVNNLRERVLADRHVAALYQIAGNDIKLPDPDEQRELFDEWLVSPTPTRDLDPDRIELLRALGLRR